MKKFFRVLGLIFALGTAYGIFWADFADKVTMEALISVQRFAIGLHSEVQQDLIQGQRQ